MPAVKAMPWQLACAGGERHACQGVGVHLRLRQGEPLRQAIRRRVDLNTVKLDAVGLDGPAFESLPKRKSSAVRKNLVDVVSDLPPY